MTKSKINLIAVFFVFTFFSSCANKIIPVKGNYLDKPYEITTNKTKEEVWENIIDFFATKGLSIKIIDKSSGLIISDKTSLTYTYENKNGNLIDPTAWIVIEKQYNKGANKYVMPKYAHVIGDWNIRIKELPKGQTSINVNVVNIQATSYTLKAMNLYEYDVKGLSIGNFEKLIADKIK